jgi:hypothetical protein
VTVADTCRRLVCICKNRTARSPAVQVRAADNSFDCPPYVRRLQHLAAFASDDASIIPFGDTRACCTRTTAKVCGADLIHVLTCKMGECRSAVLRRRCIKVAAAGQCNFDVTLSGINLCYASRTEVGEGGWGLESKLRFERRVMKFVVLLQVTPLFTETFLFSSRFTSAIIIRTDKILTRCRTQKRRGGVGTPFWLCL